MNNKLLLERFKESGLSYSELADEICISRSTIRNIMFGHTNPSYYVLTNIAEALELTNEDIIEIFFPNLIHILEVTHDQLTY